MSELNGDLNGRAPLKPCEDFDLAADLLFTELAACPWFVGIERVDKTLIVEARDVAAALAWANGRDYFGWTLAVKRSRTALVRTTHVQEEKESQAAG